MIFQKSQSQKSSSHQAAINFMDGVSAISHSQAQDNFMDGVGGELSSWELEAVAGGRLGGPSIGDPNVPRPKTPTDGCVD